MGMLGETQNTECSRQGGFVDKTTFAERLEESEAAGREVSGQTAFQAGCRGKLHRNESRESHLSAWALGAHTRQHQVP